MTPEQITALRNYIKADSELVALSDDGQDQTVAEQINDRTAVAIIQPRLITSRGIAAALGLIAGETFVETLETFAAATLPGDHPLLAYQPGIKRQITWIEKEGLDLGEPLTRQMLDSFAAVGLITADTANALKAVAEKTVPYPVSVGWGILSANNIAWAVRDALGNSLLGA